MKDKRFNQEHIRLLLECSI